MTQPVPITVAYGDGIGPEIMAATLEILTTAQAQIAVEKIEIGEHVYERGIMSGIAPEAWDSLRSTKVFLKAPITTPQGKGVQSLNVTVRASLGLYGNVRPCHSYHPFVKTKHPHMDVVIIRENEEGLYGGIEHRQTPEVCQTLKLISVPGCERISRFAFEYAQQNNRKKISCFTKDNIMKLTDGLFHKVFLEVAQDYPDIEADHYIVDIGTARLADTPERFDIILAPNLYGDILSDLAGQIAGSVGTVGTANIGEECAMFEAIHGSAPDIAGQNIANPSALLLASVMMLVHIGQPEVAGVVHNAWLKTIEDGIHTADIYDASVSKRKASTKEFTQAVIDRLSSMPRVLTPASYSTTVKPEHFHYERDKSVIKTRELVGVDVFVYWVSGEPKDLANLLQQSQAKDFELTMISNRGVAVWPKVIPETFCTDHWRCRFMLKNSGINNMAIVNLLKCLTENQVDIIKTENLYNFAGERGYSLGRGV